MHENEDYDLYCLVEEDDNFPGYVKLSLAEEKNDYVYLDHCRRMNEDKLYLSNSMMRDIITSFTLNILYQAVRGLIVCFMPGYERDRRIWPHFVMNAIHTIYRFTVYF
jgi:hypothetical protein